MTGALAILVVIVSSFSMFIAARPKPDDRLDKLLSNESRLRALGLDGEADLVRRSIGQAVLEAYDPEAKKHATALVLFLAILVPCAVSAWYHIDLAYPTLFSAKTVVWLDGLGAAVAVAFFVRWRRVRTRVS